MTPLAPHDVARLREGATPPPLIDVRESDEWTRGHLPGAVLVPASRLMETIALAVPDRSAPAVLYCEGGSRAPLMARAMALLGYQDVSVMAGGYPAWLFAGLPVSFEDPAGALSAGLPSAAAAPSNLVSSNAESSVAASSIVGSSSSAAGRSPATLPSDSPPRPSDAERLRRYSRHILMPEVGPEGQAKLLDSKVLIVGAGGLGSPVALYLAAAGVGTLGIVDFDDVDLSNLQRQVLHASDRVGMPKVESARRTIGALNPDVRVEPHREMLGADNVERLIAGVDVIVDGTDSFETRYVLNDASVAAGIPVVHASVYRFEGQLTVFKPGFGPCYRCLFPTPPPPELALACSVTGVLGVVPGIMGMLQANEVLKLLLGIGEPLIGRLLMFDALDGAFREVRFRRDPACPACGGLPDLGAAAVAPVEAPAADAVEAPVAPLGA